MTELVEAAVVVVSGTVLPVVLVASAIRSESIDLELLLVPPAVVCATDLWMFISLVLPLTIAKGIPFEFIFAHFAKPDTGVGKHAKIHIDTITVGMQT
jgi:hypothetical protein